MNEQKKLLKEWKFSLNWVISKRVISHVQIFDLIEKLLEAQKAQTQDEERKRAWRIIDDYVCDCNPKCPPISCSENAHITKMAKKILNPESNE